MGETTRTLVSVGKEVVADRVAAKSMLVAWMAPSVAMGIRHELAWQEIGCSKVNLAEGQRRHVWIAFALLVRRAPKNAAQIRHAPAIPLEIGNTEFRVRAIRRSVLMARAKNVHRRPCAAMEARRRVVTKVASGKIPRRVRLDALMVYAQAFVSPRRSNASATCPKNVTAPDRGNLERLVRAIRSASMETAYNVRPMRNDAMVRSSKRAMRMECGN